MAEAICLRCGMAKSRAWKPCKRCSFDPTIDDQSLVRSVYLSTGRFTDPAEQACYRKELNEIGRLIEEGVTPEFVEADLVRLATQKTRVDSIGPLTVWGAVFRLFLPAIAFLAFLFALAFIIRLAR